MFGRLTAFLLVSVLAFASARADEGDYLMGLNAYKDGLNSVARMGFEAYLADSPNQADKHYAEYLMYRILLEDGDFEGAYSYFIKIEGVKDSRFDQNVIKGDKMRFLIRKDCSEAKKELLAGTSAAGAALYTESDCPMDSQAAKSVAAVSNDSKVLLSAASKVQGDFKAVEALFSGINPKNLTAGQAKYFGVLFYKNGSYDYFWKVYGVYKDADMVSLALDRLWSIKDYKGYISGFEANRKSYSLESGAFCRAVESYKQTGADFDCALLDGCIKDKNADFAKTKTACLIKSGKPNLDADIDSFGSAVSGVCEYVPYMIDKNLYDGKSFGEFAACPNKFDIAELLYRKKRFGRLLEVASKGTDDRDYYYTALAHIGMGDRNKASAAAQKIKNADLKAYLSGQVK
ncbi:hypothetical protein EP073_08980 [Geovibrio thiophilus]|uniref:Tetratricopeptide repeat protein n=1 Tax=Geovibrio thiophilus TaxID=139438 RepID=A0A3R6AYK6_9BACT|nr:hypothetical protein [Geovibrio thiophilus]QAR33529.1 hypothetical protein EP073_08980 [Geovibrio thiophilus]